MNWAQHGGQRTERSGGAGRGGRETLSGRGGLRRVAVLVIVALALAGSAPAQGLRFGNRREVAIPEYATVRIGPFYSNIGFSQSVGYRYTRSEGAGTDFLFNNSRGVIKEDGEEFPMISSLAFRNYLLITRTMDLDASVWMSYAHYPMDTQEDEFTISLAEPGIFGTFSMEFALTPYVKGTLYDNITYRTDYVDLRGTLDPYGGGRYEYFRNDLGVNLDWLMAKDKNLALSASRGDLIPRGGDFEDQERVEYRESATYEHELFPDMVAGAGAALHQYQYRDSTRSDVNLQDYFVFTRFTKGADRGAGIRVTDVTSLTLKLGLSAGYAGSVSYAEDDSTNRVERADASATRLSAGADLKTQLSRQVWHSFGYERGLRGSFDAAFDAYEDYRYRLQWDGYAAKLGLYSTYSTVQPNAEEDDEYTSWTSGADFRYPLVSYIDLIAATSYTVRDNQRITEDDADLDPELRDGYETWYGRLGTSFAITKTITFSTFYTHIERYADTEDLEYSRDIYTADLTYNRQF